MHLLNSSNHRHLNQGNLGKDWSNYQICQGTHRELSHHHHFRCFRRRDCKRKSSDQDNHPNHCPPQLRYYSDNCLGLLHLVNCYRHSRHHPCQPTGCCQTAIRPLHPQQSMELQHSFQGLKNHPNPNPNNRFGLAMKHPSRTYNYHLERGLRNCLPNRLHPGLCIVKD